MNKPTIVFAIVLIACGFVAFSYPASAACILAHENMKSELHKKLLHEARSRIDSKFGAVRSKPTVYFFDQVDKFWPLTLNPYGSTSFLGLKTCVAIGPDGQNIDVVAHELMHAEIESRAGFWARSVRVPVWFDEGLAMQVDHRARYDLEQNEKTAYVTELKSGKEFFESNMEALIFNYGAAKSEVGTWLSTGKPKNVYELLDDIKQGASFDSIWQSSE